MSDIINAQNLVLGYDAPVIKDATFSIKTNDFIIITGKSGSGKSTLLKSFYGGIDIKKGSLDVCFYSLNGIKGRDLNALRRKIGIVFQDYQLIDEWTIERNVMLPLMIMGYDRNVCKTQSEKLLTSVRLGHKMGKFPPQLSGGEQQRVAVARAMSHNPQLLLCDEPTGNLDEVSSSIVWDYLRLARDAWGACVVVVTHKAPSTLKFDFRHFEIDDGRVYEKF